MNLNSQVWLIVLLIVCLHFVGCKKESEWDKTVRVQLEAEPNEEEEKDIDGASIFHSESKLLINGMKVKGKRLQGENVEVELDNSFEIDISNGLINKYIEFDLPQGTYTKLRIEFISEKDSEVVYKGKILENNPFFDDRNINLNVPLDNFTFELDNIKEDSEFSLIKDNTTKLSLSFKLNKLLKGIDINALNNAESQVTGNSEFININSITNKEKYGLIVSNLEKTIRIAFK